MNIRQLGAEAFITKYNYDDTVRMSKKIAEENNWLLVQDTSWNGYEKIPSQIMQDYTTMGLEITEQFDGKRPSQIFLQAGVGAMAGAMAAFFSGVYKEDPPKIIIAEPDQANPLF